MMNSDWFYDRPVAKSKYGKILTKLTDKNKWQVSDYTNIEHPFYEKVKSTSDRYKIMSSYYFETEALKLLLDYFENDLETKMQVLIDRPPAFEKDHPLYGESFDLVSVSFRDKTLTSNTFFLQMHKGFREVWSLSNTVKSLQDEIDKEGGLYLVFSELIEKEKGEPFE